MEILVNESLSGEGMLWVTTKDADQYLNIEMTLTGKYAQADRSPLIEMASSIADFVYSQYGEILKAVYEEFKNTDWLREVSYNDFSETMTMGCVTLDASEDDGYMFTKLMFLSLNSSQYFTDHYIDVLFEENEIRDVRLEG